MVKECQRTSVQKANENPDVGTTVIVHGFLTNAVGVARNLVRKMPRVLNKRKSGVPDGAVYVGRPSKWGNPFTHIPDGTLAKYVVDTRDEAVDRYREYLLTENPLLADLHELRGKDLVCWCAPQRCHADILLELANAGI